MAECRGLPNELLHLIFENVEDKKTLRNVSIASRRFHAVVEEHLYALVLIPIDDDGHALQSLVRVLYEQPERAALVKKIIVIGVNAFGDCLGCPRLAKVTDSKIMSQLKVLAKKAGISLNALHAARPDQVTQNPLESVISHLLALRDKFRSEHKQGWCHWMNALKNGHFDAWLALLLTMLPNLESLHLAAHPHNIDGYYIRNVVKASVAFQNTPDQTLKKLREVIFESEFPQSRTAHPNWYSIPTVRKIADGGCTFHVMRTYSPVDPPTFSPALEELVLDGYQGGARTAAILFGLKSCTNLRTLRIVPRFHFHPTATDVSQALLSLKDSLEVLEVRELPPNYQLGSLERFQKLRQLTITLTLLLGQECDRAESLVQLLPASLKELNLLYRGWFSEWDEDARLKRLVHYLDDFEAAVSARLYPQLRSITLIYAPKSNYRSEASFDPGWSFRSHWIALTSRFGNSGIALDFPELTGDIVVDIKCSDAGLGKGEGKVDE